MALGIIIQRISHGCFSKSYKSNLKFNKFIFTATKMDTDEKLMFFNHLKEENKISIKVFINENSVGLTKELNFERAMSELINVFLTKLSVKVGFLINKKKKKNTECTTSSDIKAVFFKQDIPIKDNITFEELFKENTGANLKVKILDSYYSVVFNCPFIIEIKLPHIIKSECPVVPKKIIDLQVDMEKSTFTWHKNSTHKKWEKCGIGLHYVPSENDISHTLKLECVPKNEFMSGPTYTICSDSPVISFKANNLIKKRHSHTKSDMNEEGFRIVSYNILADTYTRTKEAKTSLFTYCNPLYLDYFYRIDLINFELLGYKADLICLQEVDNKTYKLNLKPLFNSCFNSIFYGKTPAREGCALFWNKNKFNCLQSEQVAINKAVMNNTSLQSIKENIEKNVRVLNRLSNISNVLQVCVLESLCSPDNLLVIGNTHLYFHPDADHIRLLQGIICFKIILETVKSVKDKYPGKKVSVLFCGDFNSAPENGVYKFLTEGSISSDYSDWKSNENEIITDISFNHSLKIKSAYGKPKYTNYTEDFKGCLDYIFFEADCLEISQVVPFPSEEELSLNLGIPNEFFPSDHLALVADFKWKI